MSEAPETNPAVTSLTAKAGDKVDNYTIMEQVGAGGTAIVFRGHDHVLNRNVAIKQIVVPPGHQLRMGIGQKHGIGPGRQLRLPPLPQLHFLRQSTHVPGGLFNAFQLDLRQSAQLRFIAEARSQTGQLVS